MRAVWLTAFGGPELLTARETPDPEPGPGQVVIEVAAAVVNFVDTLVRADRTPWPMSGPKPPFIPGNGVGGAVIQVGDGVDPSLLGQRVIAGTGGSGGYAELVAVPADALIGVPDGLDLVEATALLADGRTALGLVDAAAPQSGEAALILAAAGGVGSLLVQLCAARGASVFGAAGGPEKAVRVASLGAGSLDYDVTGWADGLTVDVVFDGVGGERGNAALGALRSQGRFVQYGLSSGSPTQMSRDDVTHIGFGVLGAIGARSSELTRQAVDLAVRGQLRPTVGQTYPLEHAGEAHAAVESRATVGRTLLTPRS